MRIIRKSWLTSPVPANFSALPPCSSKPPHQTSATALDESECIEVDRQDITVLLQRKPHAGMDMLTVLGRQFHASQQLVRVRDNRHPNEVIEEETKFGERVADSVARFGGSWTFIIFFAVAIVAYV